MKRIFNLWLPVLLWMSLLYYLSSIPNLRVSTDKLWDEISRTLAHLGFYALGYFLFFRAINSGRVVAKTWLPLVLAGGYGLFDEIHQSWVPTRTFQVKDLLVNFSGILAARALTRFYFSRKEGS